MDANGDFGHYVEHLAEGLARDSFRGCLADYCLGLMSPLGRKSIEPMAAYVAPLRAAAKHQSLHHFVAKSAWSDTHLLSRVAQWVMPRMDFSSGGWWIIDDTSVAKKGTRSIGVARQYASDLNGQFNCQIAISISLACKSGRLPLAWQLYLPPSWAADPVRRMKSGVPEEIEFATKPRIALLQLRRLLSNGAPGHLVIASAGYGSDYAFRQELASLGLSYIVGITPSLTISLSDAQGITAETLRNIDQRPVAPGRRVEQRVVDVKTLAQCLPDSAFGEVSFPEGADDVPMGRFAALHVKCVVESAGRTRLLPRQWLLIERSEGQVGKCYLSTLPETTPPDQIARMAYTRWRDESSYRDNLRNVGLGHYEGRGWRGFHHHASLCTAAYGFLLALALNESGQPQPEIESGLKTCFLLASEQE